jgi:hypothetical protein
MLSRNATRDTKCSVTAGGGRRCTGGTCTGMKYAFVVDSRHRADRQRRSDTFQGVAAVDMINTWEQQIHDYWEQQMHEYCLTHASHPRKVSGRLQTHVHTLQPTTKLTTSRRLHSCLTHASHPRYTCMTACFMHTTYAQSPSFRSTSASVTRICHLLSQDLYKY